MSDHYKCRVLSQTGQPLNKDIFQPAASVEIHWIPKHICCLIKAQALSEMEGERA